MGFQIQIHHHTIRKVISIIILTQSFNYFTVNGEDELSTAERTLIQLCPELVGGGREFVFYRYDNDTKKCYDATGETGPCGKNMLYFGAEDDNIFGYCDCDNDASDRTLIFHPSSNQCYFVYQQAYCSAGQWLILDSRNGLPRCIRNPCSKNGGSGRGKRHDGSDESFIETASKNDEMVLFNNRCVKLGSHQPECNSNQVIQFVEGSINPTCTELYEKGQPVAAGVVTSGKKCRPGSVLSITGKCQTAWTWD